MASKKKLLQAAAGSAGGGGSLDVDEVFSTYLYDGTGSALTINNGLDLSGEGGLVWTKRRDHAGNGHMLVDTARGGSSFLKSNTTDAANTSYTLINSFNSNGYTLSTNGWVNGSGDSVCSWTFRKAPKFFDVVQFTNSTGGDEDVSHNLNAVPAMIIGKRTDTTDNWMVWHIGTGMSNGGFTGLGLDNSASAVFTGVQSDQGINSSTFNTGYVLSNDGSGGYSKANTVNGEYIFYLFAHNNSDGEFGPSGDQDVIKCGSFVNDSSSVGVEVDLGFEPQFLLIKGASSGSGLGIWMLIDNMRGASVDSQQSLRANGSNAETSTNAFQFTSRGFTPNTYYDGTLIYMAIRRGPLAEPESATDVFAIDSESTTSSTPPSYNSGFAVDMFLSRRDVTATDSWYLYDRLRKSDVGLSTNSTAAESTSGGTYSEFDRNDGIGSYTGTVYSNKAYGWMWKRAPSYFDVITWKVDGTGDQTINHGLTVSPEMVWSKNRNDSGSGSGDWWVAHKDLTGWDSANENDRHALKLSSTAASTQQGYHRDFSSTSIRLLGNAAGGYDTSHNCIAYLFATVAGVSKVGSFTGTAATQTIDCGFSSGARFVLIKETNTTGGWMVFDTVRGIVSGNDARLELDDTGAESTASDILDPHSSGFQLPSSSFVNASGRECIFYAIA